MITVGTTRFAVGGRGAKWAALAREGGSGAPAARSASSGAARGKRRGLAFALAGVLAAIGLTGTGIRLGGGAAPMLIAAPAPEVPPVEVVRAALAGLPFRHAVRASAAVDGTLDAEGYVQTVVERRAVLNALNDTRLQVRRRIWVRELIENEVAELIRSQNLPVEHSLSEDGVLTLSGDVLDPAQAARIVGLIRAEVFGLSGLDDRIRTPDHYLAEVRGVLDSARLRDRVILRLDGQLIEATGVVINDQIDNWVGFVQVYTRRYAPILPLRSFVTLEAAGGEVGAPIVIGAADPGQGRVFPAEALSSDAVPQAQDIFALPATALAPPQTDPAASDPAAPGAVAEGAAQGAPQAGTASPTVTDADRQVVLAAAARLIEARPDLADRMLALQAAGQTPDMPLIQEVLGIVGGRMVVRAGLGGIEPLFLLPGSEVPLTLAEVVAALTETPERSAEPAAPEGAALPLPGGEAGAQIASGDRSALLLALLDGRAAPGVAPLGDDTAIPPADAVALEGFRFGRPDQVEAATATANADANAAATADANAAGCRGRACGHGRVAGFRCRRRLGSDARRSARGCPATGGGHRNRPARGRCDRPGAAGRPRGACRRHPAASGRRRARRPDPPAGRHGRRRGSDPADRAPGGLSRLSHATAARCRAGPDDLGHGSADRAAGGHRGRCRGPAGGRRRRGHHAGPGRAAESGPRHRRHAVAGACAAGGHAAARPAARFLLGRFVGAGAGAAHDHAVARHPQPERGPRHRRGRSAGAGGADGGRSVARPAGRMPGADRQRRGAAIAGLVHLPAESTRNRDFGQFLFRNVPVFDLALTGVNLQGDRYVQAVDGRRLRAGMAPTLNSRLSVIGDLGALFRVEGGYLVLLYPQTLSWRIARN